MAEPETRQKLHTDPSVKVHRPASGKSQDVSHVLANIFKDLYTNDIIGKDTVSNLVKTKHGRGSYHNRYVEELQQAHSEYEQSIKEADMLESHIIQARAQAAASETQAYEREAMGDIHIQQGPLAVRSTFSLCVDKDLLEMNNLISPNDYLPTQKAYVKAPAAVKWNPAKPTFSYAMHVSQKPQDNDYTVISSPQKTSLEATELDHSVTFESCSDTPRRKKTHRESNQTKPRPKWKDEPSAKDRTEGWEKLQKLKDRQSFLRNPRFLPPNAQQGSKSLIQPRTKVKAEHERNGTEKKRHWGSNGSVHRRTDLVAGELRLKIRLRPPKNYQSKTLLWTHVHGDQRP